MANKPLLMTDRWVESVKVPEGRVEFQDLKISNLRLRVSSTGKKVWAIRTKVQGQRQNKTLGRYPGIGVAAARTAAIGVLEAIAEGKGEVLDKTVKDLVDAWIERHAKQRNKTWEQQERRLELHALPVLGDRKVRDVKRADVRELIAALDGDVLPNRVLASLKTVFRWAVENDWIDASPVEGIRKPKIDASRDRVLTMDELATVWRESGRLGYPFTEYVRVLMLTGQRRSEIAGMKWDWVDLDAATLTLPAEVMKNGRAHLVPLPPAAVAILKDMPRFGQAGYCFTTTGDTPISGFAKLKARLDKFIGDRVAPWTFHDLRRSLATHAVRIGVLEEVVSKVLSHTPQGVTAKVYALHRYEPEKRSALDRWAAELERAVTGSTEGNVVKLRTGR